MIAEPDYDFKMETRSAEDNITDKVLLSSEVMLIKCTCGRALININSREHEFAAATNFLLAEGMMFKVQECSPDFKITILRFSLNFFNLIYPMLSGKAVEVMAHSAPDLYKSEDGVMLDLIFTQLCLLHEKKEHTWRNKIAVNLMINYILEMYEHTYRIVEDNVPKVTDHRTFLIDRFFQLCVAEHSRYRNIEYYASRLNITSRYLHKICRKSIQQTPKQCIDYIVSGSAKKLLLTTSLTNQQIAHELNFPDQTTFGQYFKRNVGMSPSEFRSKFK